MNIGHLVYFLISTSVFIWLLISYVKMVKLVTRLADAKDVAKALLLVANYFDFLQKEKD